jgi:flavin-binding protein dodecin
MCNIRFLRFISEKAYFEKLKCFESIILKGVNDMVVVKIIELIGSSPDSWEKATENAVAEAAKTIRNIKGVDLKRCTAKVKNNKIIEYRAVINIAFVVESEV